MNERIKELAIKAGFPEWSNHAIEFELEQFAELIVNECLNICEELGDKGMDGHYCADAISKTFRS